MIYKRFTRRRRYLRRKRRVSFIVLMALSLKNPFPITWALYRIKNIFVKIWNRTPDSGISTSTMLLNKNLQEDNDCIVVSPCRIALQENRLREISQSSARIFQQMTSCIQQRTLPVYLNRSSTIYPLLLKSRKLALQFIFIQLYSFSAAPITASK